QYTSRGGGGFGPMRVPQDAGVWGRLRPHRDAGFIQEKATRLRPYFFVLPMSVAQLVPKRRAASDWLPSVRARATLIRLRSNASTGSGRLGEPWAGGGSFGSAAAEPIAG